MKKLITLLFLVAFTLSVSAQRSSTTVANVIPQGASTKALTLIAVDSVSNTSTGTWIFDVNKTKTQYFAVSVKLAPLGVTALKAHAYVNVLGSIDKVTWVATTATQVKYGGGADSSMVLYDISTGVMWRYLKVTIDGKPGAGGATTFGTAVKAIAIKVGDK